MSSKGGDGLWCRDKKVAILIRGFFHNKWVLRVVTLELYCSTCPEKKMKINSNKLLEKRDVCNDIYKMATFMDLPRTGLAPLRVSTPE